MRALLLFMPLLMACGNKPQLQLVKDQSGRVRAEVTRVDGRKDGPVRFFDTNGVLQTTGRYARDSRHGAWTTVGPEGDTLSIVRFKYGQKDGLQGYWAPNGQLLRLERFKDGEPNGVLYRFFADGSPRQVTWYEKGIPNGTYIEWYKVDSASIAITMGEFKKGERSGLWTRIYGNGRVTSQGKYVGGNKVGLWRAWDPSGRLLQEIDHGKP